MNYLAHAWLARHSDETMLGAILGDFVFGQSTLQDWPVSIRSEIVNSKDMMVEALYPITGRLVSAAVTPLRES